MSKASPIENRLKKEYGDLDLLIPNMVSQEGQEETARKLRVKQAWVSRWLDRNGYVKRVTWEKHTTQGVIHEPA